MFFPSLGLSTVNRVEKMINSFDKETSKLKKACLQSDTFTGVNTLKKT